MPPKTRRVSLAALRRDIDQVDKQIIGLLKQRTDTALRINHIKIGKKLPIRDKEREAIMLKKREREARLSGLPEKHVLAIFERIISMSRRAQSQARQQKKSKKT
jgi:chorismate mutase/prephenate dehydratase